MLLFNYNILLLFIGTLLHCANGENTVTLFTDMDFKGANQTYDASKCISPLPHGFDDSIASIHTHGNCVHLYREKDCVGDFLFQGPYIPGAEKLNLWKTQSGVNYIHNTISSIGPSVEDCSPERFQMRPKNGSTVIKIYHDSSPGSYLSENLFKGEYTRVRVQECVPIKPLFSPYAAAIEFLDSKACVEFYDFVDCTKPLYLRHSHTPRFFLLDAPRWNKEKFLSLSLCGYNCPAYDAKDSNDNKELPTDSPTTTITIITTSTTSTSLYISPTFIMIVALLAALVIVSILYYRHKQRVLTVESIRGQISDFGDMTGEMNTFRFNASQPQENKLGLVGSESCY